ncbi:MAG TPA: hypothetical protein VGK74_18035 [Symbiobacteriaceae bacterium]
MLNTAVPAAFPQVLVVHGPTGGAGKTMLALLLSYLYARKGHATVLVDLSQYGAVAPWLQIPRGAGTGLTGLLAALRQGGPTDERIRSALIPAPQSGERLQLVLSSGAAKMDQVKAADVEALIGQLAGVAEVVIVDTGSELTDRTLGALMAATRVVLAIPPQVVSGWQTLDLLEIMRSAYVKRERLGVAFTRVQPGSRFGVEEFAQTLGLPQLGIIPESPDLRKLGERGGPPDIRPRTPGLRAVRALAHNLIPIFTPKELSGPWPLSR